MKKHRKPHLSPYDSLYNKYSKLQKQLQGCETSAGLVLFKETYEQLKQIGVSSDFTEKQSLRIGTLRQGIDELISEKEKELASVLSEQSELSESEHDQVVGQEERASFALQMFSELGLLVEEPLEIQLSNEQLVKRVDREQEVEDEDDTSNKSARAELETEVVEGRLVIEKDGTAHEGSKVGLQMHVEGNQAVEEEDDTLYESPGTALQNAAVQASGQIKDEEISHEHSKKLGSPFEKLKQHSPKKPHSQLSQKAQSVEMISLEQQQSLLRAQSLPNHKFKFGVCEMPKSEKATKEDTDDERTISRTRKQHLQKVIDQLQIIRAKIEKFDDKRIKYFNRAQFKDADEYLKAIKAAQSIHNSIVLLSRKYMEDGDLDSFKSASTAVLSEDSPNVKTLQEHRGWKLILTNLAAFIFTAGLAHVGYSLYNGRFSLFEPATDSSEKVAALRESVNTVTLTV